MTDDPSTTTERIDDYCVAVAKHLFLHPRFGYVTVPTPITLRQARHYELTPLLLYALSACGLKLRATTFSRMDAPRSHLAVLSEAWNDTDGPMYGLPDRLRVSRALAACSPELAAVATLGVRLEVVSKGDKTLSASLRSAQLATRESHHWLRGLDDETEEQFLETMRRGCADDNQWPEIYLDAASRERLEQRSKQPIRPLTTPLPTAPPAWQPQPWMWAWEKALPPSRPRRFFTYSNNAPYPPSILLLEDEGDEDLDQDDQMVEEEENEDLWRISLAKDLIACWPNPRKDLAHSVGITLRQLNWYLSEKATLADDTRRLLEAHIGIESDPTTGGDWEARGPCVLNAASGSRRAVYSACDTLSHGGDGVAFELVPQAGQAADPRWRYFIINTFAVGPNVMMVPRGHPIAEVMPDALCNYKGSHSLPGDLYNTVVATCGRACLHPSANVSEMKQLTSRHFDMWWDLTFD